MSKNLEVYSRRSFLCVYVNCKSKGLRESQREKQRKEMSTQRAVSQRQLQRSARNRWESKRKKGNLMLYGSTGFCLVCVCFVLVSPSLFSLSLSLSLTPLLFLSAWSQIALEPAKILMVDTHGPPVTTVICIFLTWSWSLDENVCLFKCLPLDLYLLQVTYHRYHHHHHHCYHCSISSSTHVPHESYWIGRE